VNERREQGLVRKRKDVVCLMCRALAANISCCGGWAWQERGGVSPSVLLLCSRGGAAAQIGTGLLGPHMHPVTQIYSTCRHPPGLYKSSAKACSHSLRHSTRRARGRCRGSSKRRPSLLLGPLQAEQLSTALAAPSRQLPSRPQPPPQLHLDRMLSQGNSSRTVITPPFFFLSFVFYNTVSEAADIRKLLRYGHPGPFSDMGNRLAFASSYDRRMRNPSWVKQRR